MSNAIMTFKNVILEIVHSIFYRNTTEQTSVCTHLTDLILMASILWFITRFVYFIVFAIFNLW